MKEVIFVLTLCFISLMAVGQVNTVEHAGSTTSTSQSNRNTPTRFDKGHFFFALNGSTGASNSYQDFTRKWSVIPQLGYFVANQLIVGFQFSTGSNFGRLKYGVQPTASRYEYKTNSYLPEIYSRYYLLKFRVSPFFQLSTGYNFHKGEKFPEGKRSSINSRKLAYSGAFGVNFRIGKNFGIEALYNTRFDNYTIKDDANDILKYRLGFSVFIR